MPLPTPHSLSPHFTSLIGRPVAFKPVPPPKQESPLSAFGVYRSMPAGTLVIVKADVALLGSFAGALVGLPDSEVRTRLAAKVPDEILRDAIREVLNVASAAVSLEGRTVLDAVAMSPADLDPEANALLAKPTHKLFFEVTVKDYQGGRFSILA